MRSGFKLGLPNTDPDVFDIIYPPFLINDCVSIFRVAAIGYSKGKFAEVP